ncbi:hypothetical protein PGT21_014793 [Puccinia graminis f. sp. tritici]|uniref:Putative ER transporter 6TM N-terminal domain-containing protein n=1 Tax=Puccinia graminis f. sp. tritici TaxID=56615 RepID=A0A5B0QI39_PUCGR|nr:hypothetical protein PGT21_014793 [Puccinia graminis f. sp. tritici]
MHLLQHARSFALNSLRRVKKSRNTIPVLKGTLAYLLFFILFFLKPFQGLFPNPITGSSAVLITIVSFPGWSVDACLDSLFLGMLGAVIGGLNFLILGKLAPYPVAQAVVFFPILYTFALIKTKNPKFLILSLICISMSWNGVYNSTLSPNRQYSHKLLESYLQTYAWAGAIVVFVNVFILPHSSEAELRTTLVHSIDNIRTLSFLIKKTYWCTITDEESKVRDNLVQSIRADFHVLQAKLNRTFLGITYSKWSGDDYKKMVKLTKSMQQSLISTHSNLSNMKQSEARIFIDQVTATGYVNSDLLRKYVYVGLTEVQKELALGSESAPFVRAEMELLKDINLERLSKTEPQPLLRSSPRAHVRGNSSGRIPGGQEAASQLTDMQNQIALEISEQSSGTTDPSRQSPADLENTLPNCYSPNSYDFTALAYQTTPASLLDRAQSAQVNFSIRQHWNNSQMHQHEVIGQIYQSGKVYHPQEPLLVESITTSFRRDFLENRPYNDNGRQHLEIISTAYRRSSLLQPILSPADGVSRDPSHDESPETTGSFEKTQLNEYNNDELQRSLLRTFSHSFIMGMFLEDLIELREFVMGTRGDEQPRRKKFHTTFWLPLKARLGFRTHRHSEHESRSSTDHSAEEEMTMREALETLKGNQYVPNKMSLLERVLLIEKFLRSPDSICAFKVACAVTTLAVLYWCDSTRDFAQKYNLNTAIITLVVAITPTLGQSWLSFMLQISGQGLGLLYGMIALELFKNVGGYRYNPYGIIAAMALFAVPMNVVLYTNPKLFVMSLLAMNSAGTLVYPLYLNQNVPFDSPVYRMGKSLTSLAIAIAIVSFFQLFVVRNPARRTLRKAMAKVMKANTAYTVILQAYVSSTIPTDPSHRSSPKVIQRVAKDLMKREARIQADITALMPLMNFASVEPAFGKPFNAAEYLKIARANQLILDRNRDARIAIGTRPLPTRILTEFVEKLAPYRRASLSRIKTSLYLCTSTLQSKFPLPENISSSGNQEFGQEILHDALVLACRLATSPDGLQLVKSKELTRYWLYLSSINSGFAQLECIQESAKKIFGRLEDETFNYYKEVS